MSAFEEFDQERRAIDTLLEQGYQVIRIAEDLDGARVTFTHGGPGQSPVELLLLTADARKHVTTVVFAGRKPAAPIETVI
ncbi:hypothetical protein PAECIP111892_03400 [Paenibacillus auburnensis]|uniref:Uncharacterized protein n=1 Tax=Paenibacillus auburnensis TaxID=2905649 RepID=A0ABM9CE69_9BACL|nr:hypothetical protein [Paenibacillus auburnensis]CAH1210090.1 hypothetical protein PAECIP111892_03400 [Paenibacillus auburnensis]